MKTIPNHSFFRITLASLFFLITVLLPAPAALPQNQPVPQVITLKDGTVLKGHLVSVTNDTYVVQTEHVGKITIPASELISLTADNAPSASVQNVLNAIPPSLQGAVQDAQHSIMNDPVLLNTIKDIANDPELMKLFMDPELMGSILSMDPQRIENDPSLQKLLQNPKMQEILQKVEQRMGGSLKGGVLP